MRKDYGYFAAKLTGRNANQRKLANNTYLVRVDAKTVAVRFHETNVITFHADGQIVFNSGGYQTMTTKARMGEFSDADVYQARGVWTIYMDRSASAMFADGITWTPGEGWSGVGEDAGETAKMVKRIRKYSSAYMEAFDAGDVAAPGAGDCWGCLMRSADGKGIMGKDHILSHLEESYFVPSLMARAIERFPVSMAAKGYISDKWAGTTNGEYYARIGREQLGKSLYRYLKEQMGIAA